ncbi:MAG: phosphomethylpyrimidine synthase ThiC, partial [Candidatus Micrarchaeota archaeon]
KRGVATLEAKTIAKKEKIKTSALVRSIARGRAVVLVGDGCVCGVGEGLATKINANIGASPDYISTKNEIKKLKTAVATGADTVMDLSIAGPLDDILCAILKNSAAPIGTVPIYRAARSALDKGGKIYDMSEDDIFNAIQKHISLGASFLTLHAAITQEGVRLAGKRVLGIVSRGGCFLATWMLHSKRENPLYKNFDYILEMLSERDVVISIGDALRPGALSDANDAAQLHELKVQGELTRRAHARNVSVICEGPGHMPLNTIARNVALQKRICRGAPYYVLGPLVTDIAAGYDHINAAIGGALAAVAGADFLCVVTPSEHVALPDEEDVREGVVAAKIAAHTADIVKLGRSKKDFEMGKARAQLNWAKQFSLALDPTRARGYRRKRGTRSSACSMCGDFCAIKLMRNARQTKQ